MNVIILIGNVAGDPVQTYTASGKAVCQFRLAVSRQGGEVADFFNVICTDRQAEVAAEYLTVGRRVSVEGSMEAGDHAVRVVARKIHFFGRK